MTAQSPSRIAHSLENGLAYLALVLLALIPSLEVLARKFFHTGVRNSTEYIHHLVLVLTFVAATITSQRRQHLSLSLDFKLREPWHTRLHALTALLSSLITSGLAWASLSFALNGFDPAQRIGPVPLRLLVLVMPLGYGVMAVRFLTALPPRLGPRLAAASGLLFGTFLAFPSLLSTLEALHVSAPVWLGSWLPFLRSVYGLITVPLILALIVSAVFGTPIFIILGGIAYLLFTRSGQPLEVIPNQAYSMLISHSLPAIPLFTVAGFLLSESRAGERLVRLFRALFAWMPGGLAIVAILVCTFFTTFTGASGVTILALGALLAYVLVNGHYSQRFSTGLLTATGSIGLLFPPSLPIIIYGVTAQINIKHLFVGGIGPGVVMVLVMILFSITAALRQRVEREPFRPREAVASIGNALGEILLPLAILLSYFGGLTTLVESAALAVVYAFVLEVVIHRDLKPSELPKVLTKCIPIIGGVLTILALANGLSYYIVDAEIPMKLTAWVQATVHSKYVFLLLLNLALLVVGCFLDIFSAILVVVPLIIPVSNLFGIHPVHLGIIFLANLELGYLTPPVGLNLYLASYRFGEPIVRIYRDVFPFLMLQLASVLLITYVPVLSTGLLKIFKF